MAEHAPHHGPHSFRALSLTCRRWENRFTCRHSARHHAPLPHQRRILDGSQSSRLNDLFRFSFFFFNFVLECFPLSLEAPVNRFDRTSPDVRIFAFLSLALLIAVAPTAAQNKNFHDAPASVKSTPNPFIGQQADAGAALYKNRCGACHGPNGEGAGNIPSLAAEKAQGASDGELFWYITKGDLNNGMPAWSGIPEKERWLIINFLRVLGGSKPGSPRARLSTDEAVETAAAAPAPKAPFTDYRNEKPGVSRKISLTDLPEPFATPSS